MQGQLLIIDVDGFPKPGMLKLKRSHIFWSNMAGTICVISTNEEERARIWLARKASVGNCTHRSAYLTIDVTVPSSRLAEMLFKSMRIMARYSCMQDTYSCGDGNLHPTDPDP